MFYADSYQTTIGSLLVTKTIVEAVKRSIIRDNLGHVNLGVKDEGDYKSIFITGTLDSETEIPLFTHPITILNFNNSNYICTDLRFFVRKDAEVDSIEKSIKNRTEFNFAKSRAILNSIWLNQGEAKIKNGLSFAGLVYAKWLSEVIAKNYALDFKDQTTLAVISHFFYQSLFTGKTEFTDEDRERMAPQTIKATQAPAEYVFEVFEKITHMRDINDYCSAVSTILENVRLEKFNLAILLTIVKNSWYGTNAKEIIQVAVEHPPTWCAIVYTALNERTYSSSMIYRIAERFGKRGASSEFNSTYNDMIYSTLKSEHR